MDFDIEDAIHGVDATSVLELLPERPRLLALGEPTHRQGTLLSLRNDLFRELVEQYGYRTIAIESDCMMGLVVDDYVTGAAGTLEEVMESGFSHEWGADQGNRDLVRWMRFHNEGRLAHEQVRFAGFDGPLEITGAASPRRALTALHGFLSTHVDSGLSPCTAHALDDLLGSDAQWTEPEAMMDPARSVGRSAEADRLRLIAHDLVALLAEHAPHLIARTSQEDMARARLYGRTATGLLRYHQCMADASPARMSRLLSVRDAMMADNLLALARRGPTLVHAHNSHLQRQQSSMSMWQGRVRWWSAGALVNAHLGEGYAFLHTALGTLPRQGVDTPPPHTIEGLLYELQGDHHLVDPRLLAQALEEAPLPPRESPWFGYAPLDPAHLARIDGLVFVKDVS
ncbi:erythromycin esterase family protein [Nocardiopsis sp. JB363]|uniref:erythromycin esterase family protein n=1 Tax=Nocardiopsis sp. JB363 TaxID=1434837 RepID=UPI00097A1B05|nr:erythromycin esterase family protein [Nocardiopsis sp. JB363]SIO84731.1 hypothetical protein BQ8420_03385 [Nocardiopsis sp. JB363]